VSRTKTKPKRLKVTLGPGTGQTGGKQPPRTRQILHGFVPQENYRRWPELTDCPGGNPLWKFDDMVLIRMMNAEGVKREAWPKGVEEGTVRGRAGRIVDAERRRLKCQESTGFTKKTHNLGVREARGWKNVKCVYRAALNPPTTKKGGGKRGRSASLNH